MHLIVVNGTENQSIVSVPNIIIIKQYKWINYTETHEKYPEMFKVVIGKPWDISTFQNN